jgi:cephalosporin hydroxylase
MKDKVLFLIGMFCAVALGLLLYGTVANSRHNCQEIEALKAQIVQAVEEGENQPVPQYYKTHPKELERLKASNKHLKARFAPASCDGFFNR